MSVEHLAVVLHHSRATGNAKLVLIGIANHAGDGGAWPTVETLAKYANVETRAVQKILGRLQGLGELAVAVQDGGTTDCPDYKRPNRYDVLVECPPWCDRTTQHRDTRRYNEPGLWKNPLSLRTPGVPTDTPPPVPTDTPPPVPTDTPPPVPTDTQTITKNHPLNSGGSALPQLQTAPCVDCGQAEAHPWHSEDDHRYTPVRRNP